MSGKRLTQEQIDEIIDLRMEGYKAIEISKMFNASYATILRYTKGVEPINEKVNTSEFENLSIDKFAEMVIRGLYVDEMAVEIDCEFTTANRFFKNNFKAIHKRASEIRQFMRINKLTVVEQ